jgi:hypothetical protein
VELLSNKVTTIAGAQFQKMAMPIGLLEKVIRAPLVLREATRPKAQVHAKQKPHG